MSSHHHGPMDRKLLHRDVFLSSVMAFIILFLLKLVIFNTKYIDPISLPLSDFQFTDLYYSQFKKQKTAIDTNIVILNIGDADRAGLLQQLEIVKSFQPKVIGLDVTFEQLKDPVVDSVLKVALHSDIPIVLTSNIIYGDDEQHAASFRVQSNNPYFEKSAEEGFGNFLAEEGQTVRYYAPFLSKDGNKVESFSAKIVSHFNSDAYNCLLARNKKSEIIHYQSNSFPKIDVYDIYNGADLSFLKNKIVLMGYMGPNFSQVVLEDNHLTPLNKSYGGHALPDKYGIEIHANIISMILHRSYVADFPKWGTYVLAFVICMLHMYFFIYLFVQQHKWFHLGAKVVQLASFGVIVFLALIVYGALHVKLEPSYIVTGVLLAADAIYFYEAFVIAINHKYKFRSLFAQSH
jgi:CHASE2 domain-containing sensor protein